MHTCACTTCFRARSRQNMRAQVYTSCACVCARITKLFVVVQLLGPETDNNDMGERHFMARAPLILSRCCWMFPSMSMPRKLAYLKNNHPTGPNTPFTVLCRARYSCLIENAVCCLQYMSCVTTDLVLYHVSYVAWLNLREYLFVLRITTHTGKYQRKNCFQCKFKILLFKHLTNKTGGTSWGWSRDRFGIAAGNLARTVKGTV